MFDLKIRFSVKLPPWGLVLRSQFWNLDSKIKKEKDNLYKLYEAGLLKVKKNHLIKVQYLVKDPWKENI